MPHRPEQFKQDLIERVVERVHQRLDGERAAHAESFVRQFYAHVSPNDILEESPDNLYGSALSLWMFGQERTPDELKIRAYTPEVEDHGWRS